MSATLVTLILQIIGGIAGGNAVGVAMEKVNLGPLLTTVAGALGGVAGGQIFTALLPETAGVITGHVGLVSIVGHLFAGGHRRCHHHRDCRPNPERDGQELRSSGPRQPTLNSGARPRALRRQAKSSAHQDRRRYGVLASARTC